MIQRVSRADSTSLRGTHAAQACTKHPDPGARAQLSAVPQPALRSKISRRLLCLQRLDVIREVRDPLLYFALVSATHLPE